MSTSVLQRVEHVLHDYLNGIHNGDVELLKQVMHPECRMISVSESKHMNIGMAEYFNVVANRQSPREVCEERTDLIRSIDRVSDELVSARLRCRVLGKDCEDQLTLVNTDGRWQIISKVFAFKSVGAVVAAE